MTEKKIEIGLNKFLEIYDGTIIYNRKGNVSEIKSLSLEFEEQKISDNFFRSLICEHFNIEETQVIMVSVTPDDAEFRLRFHPDKEITIIICPINVAILNTQIVNGEISQNIDASISHIGIYRRLGDSSYFFRLEYY